MADAGFPVTDGVTTLIPPPSDEVPDFDNPRQQKALEHYLVFGIMGTLAFIALLQRYYTKMFLSKGLQLDDVFMFFAWAFSVTTQLLLTISIAEKGFGVHSWEQPLERYEKYSLQSYIAAPIYQLCNGFTKLSLLTFYLHLSPQKWFRISVWAAIAFVVLYTLIITFMMFFLCSPPHAAFNFSVTGDCLEAGILYMATAVSNILSDVIIFILPIPMVLQLKMSTFQKIGAIVIFGIGSVTVATSVVRLALLPALLQSDDPSWDGAPANIWSFVEGNLFIICGSMPTLRKFFKHFAPRLMGTSSANPSSYGPSYGPNYAAGYGTNASTSNAARQSIAHQSRVWKQQRKHYEQFPEENEMQDFSSTTDHQSDKAKDGGAVSVIRTDVEAGRGDTDGDSHSDKAILQTKSFTVRYD